MTAPPASRIPPPRRGAAAAAPAPGATRAARDVTTIAGGGPEVRERRVVGVPPEVLRQVKLIELRTRGLVNSLFTGEYR